ncbi:MAG: homoserine kinase [Acidobacteriota bacterium]
MSSRRFSVRVPASTSNLGSGFDTVSAALGLYLTVGVEVTGEGGVRWIPKWRSSEENILDRALRVSSLALDLRIPGMRLEVSNPIPFKRGLGSSGAAVIAGIKIAEKVKGADLSQEEVLKIAYPLEGHPDNLAASLLGGWVISRLSEGSVKVERLLSTLQCRFVMAIPEVTISTRKARAILPEKYPLRDVVYNLQRCALLVHALGSGRGELLREAVGDALHQPYRRRLVPGLAEVLERQGAPDQAAGSLLALFISGSGSAVAAVADGHFHEIGEWMVRTFERAGISARYLILNLDTAGARVEVG